MNTRKFRTKTEFIARDNSQLPGIWEIAVDIGYGSVKLFSPNTVANFPSYARRVGNDFQFAGKPPKEAILYRDDATGELWLVGEVAQNTMKEGDMTDSESLLYNRDRYTSDMFQVYLFTGLGIAMMKNEYGAPGDSRIVIQTGLPERYLNDADDLKYAFLGEHNFELKVGDGGWNRFSISLSEDDIYVMSQPRGTLFSVCIERDGKWHPDTRKYLGSSVLVFDPGFGTLDVFPIYEGVVQVGETFSDLGMKRVLQETSRLIKEHYDVDVPVPAMQKYLETGKVRYVNRRERKSQEYAFDSLLEKANREVCEEAIRRMDDAVHVGDYNYMIVTGGTGAAWMDQIKEALKNYSSLQILPGNQNDPLPLVYSNVRGYYLYRLNQLARDIRNGDMS